MRKIPATAKEFIAACKNLQSSLSVYDLFESMSDAARNEVYALAQKHTREELHKNVEPTRASFYTLGVAYNCEILRNY